MAAYCISLLFLAVLSAEDIKERKISVCKVIFFAISALLLRVFDGNFLWYEIGRCLIPGGVLLLLAFMTNESIGYGDGMVVLGLGLWTGVWFTVTVVCVGMILSGIWGAMCLFRRKKDPIPFLPCLLIGMEVALIYA